VPQLHLNVVLVWLLTSFALVSEPFPAKPVFVIGKPGDGPAHAVFSSDGKRLYLAQRNGSITALEAATGKVLLTIRTGEETLGHVALNPQGTRLASTHPGRVRLWDTTTGKETISFIAVVPCLSFDRTGDRLACPTASDTVTVWDFSTGRAVRAAGTFRRELRTDNARDVICSLAYSPDGNSLAAADTTTGFVTVWSTATRKVKFTLLVKEPDEVWDLGVADCKVAFSADGRWIATAGSEHEDVKLWDAATGKRLRSFEGGKALAFTADSRYLATLAPTEKVGKRDAKGIFRWSEEGGQMRVWALPSGKELCSMKVPGADGVEEMAFRPGSKWVATAHSDGTVRVWDLSGVLP
jgi:WD40 repeat protein